MEPLLPVVGTIYSDPQLDRSSLISRLCSNRKREDERDVGPELRPAPTFRIDEGFPSPGTEEQGDTKFCPRSPENIDECGSNITKGR
jgi:hypothetical protein